jgi:hypothetical protein
MPATGTIQLPSADRLAPAAEERRRQRRRLHESAGRPRGTPPASASTTCRAHAPTTTHRLTRHVASAGSVRSRRRSGRDGAHPGRAGARHPAVAIAAGDGCVSLRVTGAIDEDGCCNQCGDGWEHDPFGSVCPLGVNRIGYTTFRPAATARIACDTAASCISSANASPACGPIRAT